MVGFPPKENKLPDSHHVVESVSKHALQQALQKIQKQHWLGKKYQKKSMDLNVSGALLYDECGCQNLPPPFQFSLKAVQHTSKRHSLAFLSKRATTLDDPRLQVGRVFHGALLRGAHVQVPRSPLPQKLFGWILGKPYRLKRLYSFRSNQRSCHFSARSVGAGCSFRSVRLPSGSKLLP